MRTIKDIKDNLDPEDKFIIDANRFEVDSNNYTISKIAYFVNSIIDAMNDNKLIIDDNLNEEISLLKKILEDSKSKQDTLSRDTISYIEYLLSEIEPVNDMILSGYREYTLSNILDEAR